MDWMWMVGWQDGHGCLESTQALVVPAAGSDGLVAEDHQYYGKQCRVSKSVLGIAEQT
jgi:hypothetical protein